MFAVGGGAMPVRGPVGACFWAPPSFFFSAGAAFLGGWPPYFSRSCCVVFHFVDSFRRSMVASRSLVSVLM